jgi:ferredoxin--NADP+ reductase
MNKITSKEELAPQIKRFGIYAQKIAKTAVPGQFIILRIDERGERIPLTIHNKAPEDGIISIVFQEVGKTTKQLGTLEVGDYILDLVGPLGTPMEIHSGIRVACIGGGVGVAPIFPKAQALKEAGNEIVSIIGSRTKNLLILEKEMRDVSDELYICTDDGSYGYHGFVTDVLRRLLEKGGERFDLVVAVGPLPMMKAVVECTKPYKIKTLVSLNSIMVDGTGMCGSCRVSYRGEIKFTCVDGPTFDGALIDFDELILRQNRFNKEEKISLERYIERSKK